MIKRKNVLKEPLQCEQEFSVFLKRVREESGVLGEALAEGLMDVSQLSRIESGQRPVCKTMRNRLLERLGVTSDMYENLLNIEDYAIWEQQQKILCAIVRKDFQTVEKLIKDYEKREPVEDKIKRQFCLVMKVEILKQQGADHAEICRAYKTAVRLTVPNIDQACNACGDIIEEKLLSVVEVNIVLEYAYYRRLAQKESHTCGETFAAECRFWMDYVEKSLFDELSQAKIYPKIVYYYLREVLSWDGEMSLADTCGILQICERAVEMLRDTGRAFYLIELLECKRLLLRHIITYFIESGEVQKAEKYKTILQGSVELEGLLKELYAEYDVPIYMQDCTYLYWQRWVFSIGDVLRIRRNMLGLTQQEVCSGICSVKSLRRAEKKKANMQRDTLGKVLRRLGLSKEIQKMNLVTNDSEVLQLRMELACCRNNREIAAARELLGKLKDKIRLEIPENMQYVMEAEASLDLMEGKITGKEFVSREEAALRCTLDLKEVCGTGDVYLTETEMVCIRQRMQWLDTTEKRRQIDFLLHFYEKFEKEHLLADYIAMYEFVMTLVTSELGNMGEYQLATELDKKVIKEVLRCRRLWVVNEFLYDILWNDKTQKTCNGQHLEKEKMADGLRQCLIFSHFGKRTFYEKIYLDKLHQSIGTLIEGISLHGEINSSSE